MAGTKIILFDNGKMSGLYGQDSGVYQQIGKRLVERSGVSECPYVVHDLLADLDEARLKGIVDEVVDQGPAGVVLALFDAGASCVRTFRLALSLEGSGVPCVLLCTQLGIRFVRGAAQNCLPDLSLCQVATVEGNKVLLDERIHDEVAHLLTSTPTLAESDVRQPTWTAVREKEIVATMGDAWSDLFATELYEDLCEQGLGDGLPVIPPTQPKVAACLAAVERDGREVILSPCGPKMVSLTVEKIAINAIMAGCRPDYFPVVLAAMEAMSDPAYDLTLASITTGPAGNLVLISGPISDEIGLNSGMGCLGPGFRANATIGRTVNLILRNVLGAIVGDSDLSVMGSPAEFSYCFAENVEASPWPGLHYELFGDHSASSVTVFNCECPRNVMEQSNPETLLAGIADAATSVCSNNAYVPSDLLVILNPEHAGLLARSGWKKADIKRFLFEKARNSRDSLDARAMPPQWPKWFSKLRDVPIVTKAEDIIVVVAGGWGTHSMVALPKGWSRVVSRRV